VKKIQWKKITSTWEKKIKKRPEATLTRAKKRPEATWTRLRGLKFLQIEEFKATMKNFKNYKGKLNFLDGLIGEVRLWRKKGRRTEANIWRKKYKEIIAIKRRKRNKRREELRKNEGDDESKRCSIYWMIELKRHWSEWRVSGNHSKNLNTCKLKHLN